MKRYYLGLMIAALAIALFAIPAFSEGDSKDTAAAPAESQVQAPAATEAATAQEPAVETAATEAAASSPAPIEEAPKPKELSIYGEVQSVDAASSSMSVQYYDYDSDEEKAADVVFNKDTKIDNAAALADIKKGDWADVTYEIMDGKNIAKSVMVEKEEEPSSSMPADTNSSEPAE